MCCEGVMLRMYTPPQKVIGDTRHTIYYCSTDSSLHTATHIPEKNGNIHRKLWPSSGGSGNVHIFIHHFDEGSDAGDIKAQRTHPTDNQHFKFFIPSQAILRSSVYSSAVS